jgi:hypothetical protein
MPARRFSTPPTRSSTTSPTTSPVGVVNQIWDVALMPGRLGIRVATTVLKRDQSGD